MSSYGELILKFSKRKKSIYNNKLLPMVALKQTLLTICKNVGLICMYEVMLDSQTQRGPGIPQTWRVWILILDHYLRFLSLRFLSCKIKAIVFTR